MSRSSTYLNQGKIKSRNVKSIICNNTPSTVLPKMIGRCVELLIGFGKSNKGAHDALYSTFDGWWVVCD